MTTYEFRLRSKRVPARSFPEGEVRIYLGEATNRRQAQELEHQREILKKLAKSGQWAVLAAIKSGDRTVEEVVRLAEEGGVERLHITVRDPGAAPSIGQMVEAFLETIEQPNTRKAYRTGLTQLVAAVGKDTPWDQVGRHQVNDLLDQMRMAKLAAHTRATARTAWSSFYTWLRDRDESEAEQQNREPRLRTHPVQKSQKVQTATTRHRFLLPDELDELRRVAAPQMALQYVVLAYTGMRIGEFLSRRPEEIEPTRRVRIVAREDWHPKGWPRYQHGVRDIPVHQKVLRPALEEYLAEFAGARLVFVNPRTFEPWTTDSFRAQLARDVKAAGLEYGRGKSDGITPHTFRHTLGTWLAMKDVQLLKIARILGDTVDIVVKYYAHAVPGDLDESINAALEWETVGGVQGLTGKTAPSWISSHG